MIKVLVVITTEFTSTGGLTTVMMNYYRVIDKSMIKMDFCSVNQPEESLLFELRKNNSKYFQLPIRKNVFRYFCVLKKLCRNYDIVHVNANSATAIIELQAAKQAGVKARIIHNHSSYTYHPILNKILLPLYRRSYTKAIACSSEAGEWLYGKNFMILKNAINPRKYAFNEEVRKYVRYKLGVKDDEIIIGNVGKFMVAKNHAFLIETFAKYHAMNPKSRLLLVGDGELHKLVVNTISKFNVKDSVLLVGLRNDVNQLVQAMDLFLFPSIYEGMPLSVIEAQSSGLPCVVSNNVTNLVCVGKDIIQLSLTKGAEYWAKFIFNKHYDLSRKERSQQNFELITKAGYNIENEGKELMNLYRL